MWWGWSVVSLGGGGQCIICIMWEWAVSSDIITAGARPAAQSRPGLVSSHVPPPVTSARSTPDTADGGRRVLGVGGGRGGHQQELPGRGGGDWWLESCDYTSSAAQPAPTTATVPLYRTVHCTIATVQSTTSEDTLYSILKLNLSIYLKESCKDKQLRRLFFSLLIFIIFCSVSRTGC